MAGALARARQRRRAAESGSDRAGAAAWGLTIRDGYGQTETTAQIGNSPGQPVKPGSMGRPLPGYRVALLDPDGQAATKARSASTRRRGRRA